MGCNLIIIKEFTLYSFVVILILTVESLISEEECPPAIRSIKGKGTI